MHFLLVLILPQLSGHRYQTHHGVSWDFVARLTLLRVECYRLNKFNICSFCLSIYTMAKGLLRRQKNEKRDKLQQCPVHTCRQLLLISPCQATDLHPK